MGFASGDYGMKYDYGTDLVFGIDDGNGGTVERPCCVVGITTLQTEERHSSSDIRADQFSTP